MKTILIVEDEAAMAAEIGADLVDRGYHVRHAASAAEAAETIGEAQIDAMIVDRMLPGLDGLSMIAALRAEGNRIPALVLSALSSVDDRIKGLKAGGDDYLTKPFAVDELAARVEALLRRPVDLPKTTLRVGPLELDLITREARRGERAIELLPREFKLLEYMMQRPDLALTRAMLLEDVWAYRFVPQTNLVDVHVGKLRRKIDGADEFAMIKNVPGVGFMLRSNA
ncbi:response regulator transcription factor [Beijerinckia sp. L45]|uniref:response regulator transcription factor n=1 Tax=Beijerinckia sp. L45 TaxID=1641855 RepID=UPI00131EC533|nr:response regulator transcription factor [Beijerinckia sp. L45]